MNERMDFSKNFLKEISTRRSGYGQKVLALAENLLTFGLHWERESEISLIV